MLRGQEHRVPLWVTAWSLKLKHWNKKEMKQGQISLSPSLSNQRPSGLSAAGPRTSLALCWLKHPSVASRWHGAHAAQRRPALPTLPPDLSAVPRLIISAAAGPSLWHTQPAAIGVSKGGKEGGGEETSAKVDCRTETRWQSPAITLHSRGGEKSHHWLNHLYNIRWFQQFHLMRKSTLSL